MAPASRVHCCMRLAERGLVPLGGLGEAGWGHEQVAARAVAADEQEMLPLGEHLHGEHVAREGGDLVRQGQAPAERTRLNFGERSVFHHPRQPLRLDQEFARVDLYLGNLAVVRADKAVDVEASADESGTETWSDATGYHGVLPVRGCTPGWNITL